MFGENTEKGREKFKEELEETHQLFKDFVSEHRPELDISTVATGEHWFGTKAKQLGLVDKIQTSDDYIQSQHKEKTVLLVKYEAKKGLADKFAMAASLTFDNISSKLMQKKQSFSWIKWV